MSSVNVKLIGKKPVLNDPVLIEGLPGIGNVGKVAVDFMVDELKAEKLYELSSFSFPNSAFINEDHLVELPKISVYYKKHKKKDLLFLSGDIQPVDEVASYELTHEVLKIVTNLKSREVIALGGIGLMEEPKIPKIYCSGNSKKIVKKYSDKNVSNKVFGVVGPVMGVSGLLVGLAAQYHVSAALLLAETYAHPMYVGVSGSKKMIKHLNSVLSLGLNTKKFDKEIQVVQSGMLKHAEEVNEAIKQSTMQKLSKVGETSYIG